MTFYKLQHRYKPDPVRLQLTELKKLKRVTVHLVVTQEKYSVAAQHAPTGAEVLTESCS